MYYKLLTLFPFKGTSVSAEYFRNARYLWALRQVWIVS